MNTRAFRWTLSCFFLLATVIFSAFATAQTGDKNPYQGMRWRLIGPFRAGRVTVGAGVPNQPAVYYIGTPGGGVWKTTDGGHVWFPIFDQEHVASIGWMVVGPSNPNIIYVGTGEQTQGNGVYKSTDAGSTWTNVGLQQTHVITGMVADPRDPNVVIVGAQGDVASGDQRGIFKTTDGGRTWKKTFYKDEQTGVMDLTSAPDDPKTLYATTWLIRRSTQPPNQQNANQQDGEIYRSTDEGSTWTAVTGNGLPSAKRGRIGVAVAPGSHGKTVYAIMEQGLYRSDDGGTNWSKSTNDPRILGSWYFSRVFVDPKNANDVYVAQTTMYRSRDGGKTFDGFYGAPSGDDIHAIWINPADTRHMILSVDQGAIISVDGGETWSSWFNQPTGQFYHVTTDDKFPYYVYAAQQDSGTAAVASRSDYGEITYRDWEPTGGFEFSFIAPDPLNSNIVYIGGWYGSVLRFDRVTGQIVHVLVRSPKYRTAGMAPIAFSPHDKHSLYAGAQYLLRTTNGGQSWEEVSPDLTAKPQSKEDTGPSRAEGRQAVITTFSISPVKDGIIWVGTNNGLIHLTRDGKTWQNVTPKGLPPRSTIEELEASHHDPGTAYATVIVANELKPYAFRTYDYGQSWEEITEGLAPGWIARVVRDDPAKKGILYAGTENSIYVSHDDGDHWKSLQLNLPICTVRDLAIHDNDLVAATYGRALWVLDDLSPIRQQAPESKIATRLLTPATAIRTRWDMNQDTPLPKETPAGKNPPEGAIFDYYLASAPKGPIKLAIYDSQNKLVREYSSVAEAEENTPPNVPNFWFAPPKALTTNVGHNRINWDLRYPSPRALHYSYYGNILDYVEYTLPEHAIPGDTPRQQPLGPLVLPGEYTAVLTVDGQTFKQPLKVVLDPRVQVSQQDLAQQLEVGLNSLQQMSATYQGFNSLLALRNQLIEREKAVTTDGKATETLKSLEKQVEAIANGTPQELGIGPINREMARLIWMVESGDARPASALANEINGNCAQLQKRIAQWKELETALSQANATLQQQRLAPLTLETAPTAPTCLK